VRGFSVAPPRRRRECTSIGSALRLLSHLCDGASSRRFSAVAGGFSREGILSPGVLLTLLLFMVADAGRRGYARLLESFWHLARAQDTELGSDQPVSAAAFCQARRKLRPEAVREALHRVADEADARFGVSRRWKGRRVLTLDGWRVQVQRSDELFERFGRIRRTVNPQILVSTLVDVVSRVPQDVVFAPFRTGERELLLELLDRVRTGDVLVLDRGYPSFDVLHALRSRGVDVVVRVPVRHTFKAVLDFMASGRLRDEIEIPPRPDSRHRDAPPVRLRALRFRGADGVPVILLTSLTAGVAAPHEVRRLYRMRWRIEEHYKLLRSRYLGQGQFHAKSAHGLAQEIYAQELFVAVARYLALLSADAHDAPYDELSQKTAVLALVDHLVMLMLPNPSADAALLQLLARVARVRERPRPGRCFPRRSFAPHARWTPSGRNGQPVS